VGGSGTDFLDVSGIRGSGSDRQLLSEDEFPILKGLSPLNMRLLNDAARIMHVSKGVEMLHEGDTPHDLYFIRKGKIAIARTLGGKLRIVASLQSGQLYGEFGALRKKARYASAYTTEPSEVVRVELSAVQQVLAADSEFRQRLNHLLTERMLSSFFFGHPAFTTLSESARLALAAELPVHSYDRDVRLFNQGDKPKGVYLILSGEVEVRFKNRKGEEILLEIRRDGDMIGEVSSKDGSKLAYSAVSASMLDTLLIDATAYAAIRKYHPETLNRLNDHINKRSAKSVQRLRENID
jgi:CRP-like cAMP-binding protein